MKYSAGMTYSVTVAAVYSGKTAVVLTQTNFATSATLKVWGEA